MDIAGTPPILRVFGSPPSSGKAPPAIRNLEDWFNYAPPKGGKGQWTPLRSAYQLAKAWCGDDEGVAAPAPFLKMLTKHSLLGDLQLTEGYAEHETSLRDAYGGPRVHDLLLIGTCALGAVVVGVEGKADEQFDRPLKARWKAAQEKRAAKIPTNWPVRLNRLAPALLGVEAVTPDGDLNPVIADVPYQLMSALAGTLIEADERRAGLAVLVVHVFTSHATRPDLVVRNQRAFADFVSRLGKTPPGGVSDGVLYGPFSVPGGEATRIPSNIPLLIGEVTTNVAEHHRPN